MIQRHGYIVPVLEPSNNTRIPGVGEGVKLRLARLARSLAEQDIVIRIGIERRVEINEINAGVGKNFRIAQPLEIIAKKKAVHVQPEYQMSFADSRMFWKNSGS